jgi:hypothetical protein
MSNIDGGWYHDPEAIEDILSKLEKPFFSQAGSDLKETGKGKSAYLFNNFKKLSIPFPEPIQTTTGDCVSHATSLAADALSVTEIVNGERERWVARSANEYIYHVSRVIIGKNRIRGDGSVNAWAAKGVVDYGTLRRLTYGPTNLVEYSAKRSRTWGSSQIPKELYDIAKPNNVTEVTQIKNFTEAADSLYNGYPIIVASNQGFSDRRDKDGFCAPRGNWAHSMAVLGYKDDERPGVVICNSWPSYLPGQNQWDLPPSSFFCDASVFDRMCKFNDTFALAGFSGFKKKADARVI